MVQPLGCVYNNFKWGHIAENRISSALKVLEATSNYKQHVY
jgi:hypothetical protein